MLLESEINYIELSQEQNGGIQIGSKVRAFDFENDNMSYCDGTIKGYTSIEGHYRYVIEITKRILFGQKVSSNQEFCFPPINGSFSNFLKDNKTNYVRTI